MSARLFTVLFCVLPVAAAAQQLEPASARAHIASIADSAEVARLERQHARVRTAADDLAAGFAALRLWELTSKRDHAHRARRYFDGVVDREPKNAWAHYGHALSLAADMGRDPSRVVTHIGPQRVLGLDPVSRARRALERAIAIDPSLPGALELLTRYAAETTDDDALRQARTGFENIIASGEGDVRDFIGLMLTTRALDDMSASIDAGRHAVRVAPAHGEAWLELATSLAITGDSAGAAATAYMAAIEHAPDTLLTRMWDELAIIAKPHEIEEWKRARSTSDRRSLLGRFWQMRGALASVSAGERVAEHYRRVHYAHRTYPRTRAFGATPPAALRWEAIDRRFDDRGVIYVRLGEPAHRIEYPLQARATWFYDGDDGERDSYHFLSMPGAPDYAEDFVLVRNLYCGMDPEIVAHDPRLQPLGKPRCLFNSVMSISAQIRRDAERALRSDSHRPFFTTSTPFHYDWYTFRGDGGATDVVMAVGLPVSKLPPAHAWRIALSVIDTAAVSVARAAHETAPAPAGAARGDILRTHVALSARPVKAAAYRVETRSADDGQIGMVYGGTMEVPDYRGDTLMISDIILAQQGSGGAYTRAGHALSLAPTQVFRNGEFRVFYELYNLKPGAIYRTELVVETLQTGLKQAVKKVLGREQPVRLQFDDVAADDAGRVTAELRDMTAPFPPGPYLLRITVTSADTKRPLIRERRFVIERE